MIRQFVHRLEFTTLFRGDRGRILVVLCVGWLLALGVRLVYPALLPSIREEFSIGLSEAGLIITVLWGAYAISQLLGGLVADRYGERAVLVASCTLASIGLLIVIAAPSVVPFFVGTGLVGIGVGLFGTTRITVLSDVYDRRTGTAIGICQASGNVGTLTLPPLAGVLSGVVGWRFGFGVLLPAFIGVGLALFLVVPRYTSGQRSTRSNIRDDIQMAIHSLRTRSVGLGMLIMVLMMFVYQAFTGFYPSYLVNERGFSEGRASAYLGLLFGSAIILQPVAGAARDRVGERRSLLAVLGITAFSLLLIRSLKTDVELVFGTLLVSTMLAFWPIGNTFLVEALPDHVKGTGLGFIRTVYIGLGATGPLVVGLLAERARFDEAFVLLALLVSAAAVLSVFLDNYNN